METTDIKKIKIEIEKNDSSKEVVEFIKQNKLEELKDFDTGIVGELLNKKLKRPRN